MDSDDDAGESRGEGGEGESHGGGGEGYVAFGGREAKAILYKLAPMSDTMKAEMTTYVHDGYMSKDHRFAREVYGRTNTSGRKDFADFWESPWLEEHVRETPKKRRQDSMQKASAVRTFVRAVSTQEAQDVDKYINTVNKLRDWEDKVDENESVKTVSRLVQSFERVAARSINSAMEEGWASDYGNARQHMGRLQQQGGSDGITVLCHALRRHDTMFDLFAAVVALEMSWTDATNGSRNTPIYMCRQMEANKQDAVILFVRALDAILQRIDADRVGIPLMRLNCNMCVSSNGVLIMGKDSTDAVYVLDMINSFNANGHVDLSNVKTIHITGTFDEKDELAVQAARQTERDSERRVTRSRAAVMGGGRLTDLA